MRAPRWFAAFGRDYRFSGQAASALPLEDPWLVQLLAWAQEAIHPGLNGLLLNWYDGAERHYIGKHHDKFGQLRPDAPIVTVSLGLKEA